MNKKILYIFLVTLILIISFFMFKRSGKSNNTNEVLNSTSNTNSQASPASQSVIPADKIEVVNFFGTQRCVSCLTIGKLSKKTIEEKFADEVKSGKIVFKEINGEFPENQDIMMKYQARGSSLFINAIRGEKENIEEDVTVWRLVNNETQFITYFEKKLNTLLGK